MILRGVEDPPPPQSWVQVVGEPVGRWAPAGRWVPGGALGREPPRDPGRLLVPAPDALGGSVTTLGEPGLTRRRRAAVARVSWGRLGDRAGTTTRTAPASRRAARETGIGALITTRAGGETLVVGQPRKVTTAVPSTNSTAAPASSEPVVPNPVR